MFSSTYGLLLNLIYHIYSPKMFKDKEKVESPGKSELSTFSFNIIGGLGNLYYIFSILAYYLGIFVPEMFFTELYPLFHH